MKSQHRPRGFTLLELIIAITVFAVAAVGVLSYQFHAIRQRQTALREILATRTARLILEDWKSNGGGSEYDPSSLDMGFERIDLTDSYEVTIEDIDFIADLSWNDVEQDASAGVTLRQIQVGIRWSNDFRSSVIQDTGPEFVMTTYVRSEDAGT